jgi:uncharacterized alkaline shock family protein YloU
MTKVEFEQEIDDKVFQSIVLKCLSKIQGISLIEGNILDQLFKGPKQDRGKGITLTREDTNLRVKIEVNVDYGVYIPDKAKEIQEKVSKDLTKYTGLKVLLVHVIFKNINLEEQKPIFSENIDFAPIETRE